MTFSLPPVEGRAKVSLVCSIREGFPPEVVVAQEGWWDPGTRSWHSACSDRSFLERSFNPEEIQVRIHLCFES